MSDAPYPFADDVIVRLIIAAAQQAMKASGDAKYLRSKVISLLEAGTQLDDLNDPAVSFVAMELLLTGFEIGRAALNSEQNSTALKEITSLAGKKSGEVRRARAEAGWKVHATELALKLRGTLSQRDLAAEIQALWKADEPAPKHATLLLHVQEMEREGLLPKKAR